MSGMFCSHDFGDIKKENLEKAIISLKESLNYEFGHDDYSGHLGGNTHSIVDSKVFDSAQEALDHIENKGKKGHSLVVPYRKSQQKPETAKIKRLKEKNAALIKIIDHYYVDLRQLNSSILQRVQSAKSKNRGCKECGSMIATKYIYWFPCPVCKSEDFIVTETDKKRISALEAKRKKAEKELEENRKAVQYEEKLNKQVTGEICWIIAGVCFN